MHWVLLFSKFLTIFFLGGSRARTPKLLSQNMHFLKKIQTLFLLRTSAVVIFWMSFSVATAFVSLRGGSF